MFKPSKITSKGHKWTNDSENWERNFWLKIQIGGFDQCWPWMIKSRSKAGYGVCRRKWTHENGRGKMTGSHRIAFELAYHKEPNNLQVLHKCDNPSCCNPFHLFLGTQKDNVKDMISKGRRVNRYGSSNRNAKITEEIVLECRRLYKPYSRQFSAGAMARRFGINPSNMLRIIYGNAWRHV